MTETVGPKKIDCPNRCDVPVGVTMRQVTGPDEPGHVVGCPHLDECNRWFEVLADTYEREPPQFEAFEYAVFIPLNMREDRTAWSAYWRRSVLEDGFDPICAPRLVDVPEVLFPDGTIAQREQLAVVGPVKAMDDGH